MRSSQSTEVLLPSKQEGRGANVGLREKKIGILLKVHFPCAKLQALSNRPPINIMCVSERDTSFVCSVLLYYAFTIKVTVIAGNRAIILKPEVADGVGHCWLNGDTDIEKWLAETRVMWYLHQMNSSLHQPAHILDESQCSTWHSGSTFQLKARMWGRTLWTSPFHRVTQRTGLLL